VVRKISYELYNENCFDWLGKQSAHSIHAVVTDPPYGILEFTPREVAKLRSGVGGVWRIPPEIGGSKRRPLPRFTVLSNAEKEIVKVFFQDWATALLKPLVPGAHVLVATNVLLSARVQAGIEDAGFEYRGQIIRLYRGMRGGDRPKLAEEIFPDVAVTLRGAHEPWLLFRKPLEKGLRVSENLEKWGTGGLRRVSRDQPFPDVIQSERTPKIEREIANHPTIKPQSLMRALVQIMLPLGKGKILDPFMGSGSTIAAADNVGYDAIGIEIDSTDLPL
jgi:DNA modification methylase